MLFKEQNGMEGHKKESTWLDRDALIKLERRSCYRGRVINGDRKERHAGLTGDPTVLQEMIPL